MTIIRQFLKNQKNFELEKIKDLLDAGTGSITFSGLGGTSRYFIPQLISKYLKRPYILITDLQGNGSAASQNINFFSGNDAPVYRKKNYRIKSLVGGDNLRDTCERISAMASVFLNKNMVAEPRALFEIIPPGKVFKKNTIKLNVDQPLPRDEFIDTLVGTGFRKSELVEHYGQFSTRGAVIDLFPPGYRYPLRTEFIGDSVRSLRFFDPKKQRSIDKTQEVTIYPATEFFYRNEGPDIPEIIYSHATNSELSPNLRKTLLDIVEAGGHIDELEWLSPLIYNARESILDYLNKKYLVFIDLDAGFENLYDQLLDEYSGYRRGAEKFSELIPGEDENFLSIDELTSRLAPFQTIHFNDLLSKSEKEIKFSSAPAKIVAAGNQSPVKIFVEKVNGLLEEGFSAHVVCLNENQQEKLEDILGNYELGNVNFHTGPLEKGFILKTLGIAVFTENDIYEKGRKGHYSFPEDVSSVFISSFSDLKTGDYIVHKQFGIGIYRGLKTIELKGRTGDFIECEYRGGDKIYVPVENLKLVQKYIGDGKRPVIEKLGSRNWKETVKKVKKAIENIAREILELYARRKTIRGFRFSKADQAFREFELEFNYEETLDQARSIEEVLEDMESDRPMDRLICGDVGFGKTEVALRASFRAVMDGKQVAFLVPTTLLASQHYHTFRERFRNYPVNVEMLSRFKTAGQSSEIVDKLRSGKLDVVIGTHKLLGEKVGFNNLGLVIIDEEHKFGVKHKEKLKSMTEGVDVLSLSATPIPRTLQLSLAGIRDISVIKSPPEGRLPVDVYVKNYNNEIIREAVMKEINRGGSVFFINNRIESIFKVADEIKSLIPEASIAVTHGRMREQVLEQSIQDFISGRVNLLVTTAIVESGLDIPRANTIIVNDAHTFGLADLYQLKGRVGRGDVKAFAYFLIPSLRLLTTDAVKRLTKISELRDLGSGFKLASSDLEIRGAGNLFGEQQSGTISNVGLELYLELLQDAIQRIKGDGVADEFEPEIVNTDRAYIPEYYISDSSERLYYYKRISSFRTISETRELGTELKDRYGALPRELKTLLLTMELKIKCRKLGIIKIEIKEMLAELLFSKDSPHINKYKPSGKLTLHYDPPKKYKILNSRLNQLWKANNN